MSQQGSTEFDLIDKVVAILVREGQDDVAANSQAVAQRAKSINKQFHAHQRASRHLVHERTVAVVCVFLACESESVAQKYRNWRLLAGTKGRVSAGGSGGGARKSEDVFAAALRHIREVTGSHLTLKQLALRLGVRYLLNRILVALSAYDQRFKDCVRPVFLQQQQRRSGGWSGGNSAHENAEGSGIARGEDSPLVRASVTMLVAKKNGAVPANNFADWKDRLMLHAGISPLQLSQMATLVTQLCGDYVDKDPKNVVDIDDVTHFRELLDNLDPSRVREMREAEWLRHGYRGRDGGTGGVKNLAGASTGARRVSEIEDAESAQRKKQRHEKWKKQVLAEGPSSAPPTNSKARMSDQQGNRHQPQPSSLPAASRDTNQLCESSDLKTSALHHSASTAAGTSRSTSDLDSQTPQTQTPTQKFNRQVGDDTKAIFAGVTPVPTTSSASPSNCFVRDTPPESHTSHKLEAECQQENGQQINHEQCGPKKPLQRLKVQKRTKQATLVSFFSKQ